MSKRLQPRLFDALVASGAIDETGLNDRPKARTCRGCGADTLAAWQDGHLDAVAVDPVDLTPLGELQAITDGRRTFTHWGGAGGGLDLRDARRISRWPAGDTRQAVRPEHRCGSPPPDHHPPRTTTHHTDPPF